jgi:two-component system, NtrC family, nitrogen regulation response regulator GlnG
VSLARLLVVDDQYARDPTERSLFLRKAGLVEEGAGNAPTSGERIVGQVVFSSGQRQVDNWIENDYAVVREAVASGNWAMVLLDVRFDSGRFDKKGRPLGQPGDDRFGEIVRSQLTETYPILPIVMLTSKGQAELSEGNTPYLSKHGLDAHAVATEMLRHARLTPEQTRELLGLNQDEVARAPATVAAFREVFMYADSNAPILIIGESGVGKEVVARYIHRTSGRRGRPFVAVNLAAVPKDLMESMLFGHERGAFTGATSQHIGYFEQAHGGTLFLDEIGDMPLEAQVKMLRALHPHERVIVRVGGNKPINIDFRLLCATSRDLPCMIQERTFREDLYYRISATPLTKPLRIPPLRERVEDVVPLAEAFLDKYMAGNKKTGITLSPEARERLERYPFPGNVRELENVIQWLVIRTGNHRVVSGDEVAEVLGKATISISGRADSGLTLKNALWPNTEEGHGHVHTIPLISGQASQGPVITLKQLPALLAAIKINNDSALLKGTKPCLEQAFSELLKRLAGAAIECRRKDSGKLNRQGAARLLTGDTALQGRDSARVFNEILGRPQDSEVNEEDLEELVELWKASKPPE